MPARPRIADRAGHAGANDIDFTIAVLKQEIREAVAIESPLATRCRVDPKLPRLPLLIILGPSITQRKISPLSFWKRMSDFPLPAMQVERPQAVARAEKYRAKIGEAGDEDDRWPRGEIEVK